MRPQGSFLKDDRGAVAAITIIMLVAFFALLAIVIDLGHLMLVRSQLQNAADAGALAGAEALFLNNNTSTPNWTQGQNAAIDIIVNHNKADTLPLAEPPGNVQTGVWNTTWTPTTAPANLLPQGTSLDSTHVAAVKVTVQKNATSNGPVHLTFGQIFGIPTVNVAAHATAIISNPITIGPGGLFPIAINLAMLQTSYYTNRGPTTPFYIGSNYHYPTDQAGQWTTFAVDENNVPAVRNLMANGNPSPVSVNGDIWIEPGTKTTLFADAAAYVGQTVVLPVVNNIDTHALVPVVEFVSFVITAAEGGSGKYIEGYFPIPDIIVPGGSGTGGPNSGVYTPPYLVQ